MSVNWKQRVRKLAGSNLILTVLAAMAGLGAVAAARHYIDAQVQRVEAESEARYRSASVVVAREDLDVGEPLVAGSLAVRRMPAGYLPGGAVADSAAAELIGRRLLVPLRRGDPLTRAVLAPEEVVSLSRQLPSGLRALTLAVDDISSQSGMLVPGDEIDLYFTQGRGASGTRLELLLQRVPVLATGTRFSSIPGVAQDTQYATITLSASADDAARIILAQQAGALSVALRGHGDSAPTLLSVRDSRDLVPRVVRSAPGASRSLEVLLGGDGASQPRRLWLQAGERS